MPVPSCSRHVRLRPPRLEITLVCAGFLAAGLLTSSTSPATPIFTAPYLGLSTDGANPTQVAAADLNGDAIKDLVFANEGNAGTVTVAIGNGDGTFGARTAYLTGPNSATVAARDVNGDGLVDLVVGHRTPQAVAVLLGNGDGTFGAKTDFSLGTGFDPSDVIIVDLNGDSILDIAVACGGSGTVAVLLGNGTGTFNVDTNYAAGSAPTSVAAGLLNAGSAPDLAVGNGSGSAVSVLLNDGDGKFPTSTAVTMGSTPRSVAIADVNADGRRDLISANTGANTVSVNLGNGDGTFGSRTDYATAISPKWVVITKVNGDGPLDLVVANGDANKHTVSVLLGAGGGAFNPRQDFLAGNTPLHVAAADLNGDDRMDLAVVMDSQNACAVLIGNGDGTFGQYRERPVNKGSRALAVGDLNGDGRPDIAQVTGISSSKVTTFLATGGGAFEDGTEYSVGEAAASVAIGDLDADGRRDVVATANGYAAVLLGNGDGTLQPVVYYDVGGNPSWVAIGDVSQDLIPDLVVSNLTTNTVSVLLGVGDGTFSPQTTYLVEGASPVHVALGDLNADGRLDIVTAENGGISVFLGTGSGVFGAPTAYLVGLNCKSSAIGRIDANSSPDLAVGRAFGGAIHILLNNGSGGFTSPGGVTTNAGSSVDLVDVNADGTNDIVAGNAGLFGVSVFIGTGAGGFGTEVLYGAGRSPSGIFAVAADLDGNGRPDVVVGPNDGNNLLLHVVSILMNRSGQAPIVAAPLLVSGEQGGTISFPVTAADLDGDTIEEMNAGFPSLPPGNDATITPVGVNAWVFTWHPGSAPEGTYDVTFTATNALSGSATTRLSIELAGTSISGKFLWRPKVGQLGTFEVRFKAKDQFGDTASAATQVTVISGGGAPRLPSTRMAAKAAMKGPVIWVANTATITAGTTLALDVSATATDTLKADTSTLPADNDATFTVDSEPKVNAPGTVSGDPGGAISFSVTASDADGEPIDSLVADFSSLPSGHTAVFTANAGNTAGTFSWTPAPADTGVYGVTFIASNKLVRAAATVLTVGRGLVGYWTLNDNGIDAARGNTLAPVGSVNYANGKLGRAVALSASAAGRLQGTATHAYDLLSSGFTVEFWVKAALPSAGTDPRIVRADSSVNLEVWEVFLCGGATCPPGKVGVMVRHFGAVMASLVSNQFILDEQFHHVAVTYDGSVLRLFIDGNIDNSVGAQGLTVNVGDGRIMFGSDSGVHQFDGLIDEVRIWNVERLQPQIQGAMNAELGYPTSVESPSAPPFTFALLQNRPNPFNPRTTIQFELARAGRTRLYLYDVQGREVARLVDADLPAGRHLLSWAGLGRDGHGVASGIYFYRLDAAGFTDTRRMVLLR